MSDVVIRTTQLGKLYQIGVGKARYRTVRESLMGAFRASLRPLRRDKTSVLQQNRGLIWAVKNVSLEITRGEVVGIIGRNGAGKSTLLKILCRITEPTVGSAEIKGRVAALMEVGTGFHPELTGRENVYLNGAIIGMKRVEIDDKFDEIVSFAEVEKFIDTPIKHYSSGMHLRLAFAVAAHLDPEIMLVDEVLAVGDAEFQKKCIGKMGTVAKQGRTVLFVSHNMSAIQELCTRAILLSAGEIVKEGSIEDVISYYLSQSTSDVVVFENAPVRTASVRQVDTNIEIKVEYMLNGDSRFPYLSFVVSDYLGNPICGSNPKIERLEDSIPQKPSGTIKVVLQKPKLLNGTYRLSIWFGDGKKNFFVAKDCMSFQVVNMTDLRQNVPISAVGAVFPECEWIYE